MQSTVEETEKHTVKLSVEVPPEEFGADLDRAYRRIAGQVRIPGFRKGKVPRRIIDAQIGREAVLEEFVQDSVPTYYRAALQEHELAPIADPDISLDQLEEGKPLLFTATVEIRPRIELEDYKGIKVERPSVVVGEREIDEMVDRMRERFAELEVVGRPARSGDFVLADIRASVHSEEVPEATRLDYLYEVGSNEFGEELDKELEGKHKGEILKLNAKLPERFGDRAEAEVSFSVLVKEVKGKVLPAADDEFAKTASEFDTIEQFRADLREKLQEAKQREADAEVRDLVLQKLIDGVDVELPEALVEDETEHRVQSAKNRAERAGVSLDDALAAQGWDELRFRSDARSHAVRAIKADLVLESVARAEGLEVTAEELGEEIGQLAVALGRDAKDLAQTLDRNGQVVALAGDIIRSKALDVLVENAEIVSTDATEPPNEAESASGIEAQTGSLTRSEDDGSVEEVEPDAAPSPSEASSPEDTPEDT
ncbi:MAG: trigger factor [Actinomycetota bacterium]